MLKKCKLEIIATVLISLFVVAYLFVYFGVLLYAVENTVAKVFFGIIPVLLGATMIYVCIQRITEIMKGENDDLSKY